MQQVKTQKELLSEEYKTILYNYNIDPKVKRVKLRSLESQLSQLSDLKPGDLFYESWGYDQTNIDFLKIVEISPTKKTVLCRMVSKNRVSTGLTSDDVSPNIDYEGPTLFRLRVSYFCDGATLRGSYPFSEHYWKSCKLADKVDKSGPNAAIFNCPKIECTQEPNYFYWNNDKRSVYCEGCEHCYEKLDASYREGSFSKYNHPMYETAIGYGH
jgi:hypothetical protein